MEDGINNAGANEGLASKKKQKAGLNAVRPDDYVENKFKDMAKENGVSQTDMFNRIFLSYIKNQNNENKQSALNVEAEIDLISKDLNNVLIHFKSIADKAQDTIICIQTNTEQTEKNLKLDIDTLTKKNEELTRRKTELEQSNNVFNEIKDTLEVKIKELNETVNLKNSELQDLSDQVKDKDKTIKELRKQSDMLEKTNIRLEKEVGRIHEDLNTSEIKINNLEKSNASMNDTFIALEKLKKAEITSIQSKYQLLITGLEEKIKSYDAAKEKEIQRLRDSFKIEYEAEKKLAIAEMKLELADVKSRYAEAVSELNAIKKK